MRLAGYIVLLACAATEPTGPISGPQNGSVEDSLPDLDFVALSDDDFRYNPILGIGTSWRHLLISFTEGATVKDANAALALAGGELVGAIPEAGIVQIEYAETIEFDQLEAAVASLRQQSAVEAVTEDLQLGLGMVPMPPAKAEENTHNYDWSWGLPAGGNWGLELIRAPVAWNLIRHMDAAHEPHVAILDWFFEHSDLDALAIDTPCPDDQDMDKCNHGTQIAGIIGANFDDGHFIDGIAPYVSMSGVTFDGTAEFSQAVSLAARNLSRANPRPRVVNMSLTYNWYTECYGPEGEPEHRCDPRAMPEDRVPDSQCDSDAVRETIRHSGLLFGRAVQQVNRAGDILFVVIAGNDSGPNIIAQGKNWCDTQSQSSAMGSFPAELSSPMNAAAKYHVGARPHILIAEALTLPKPRSWDVRRADFSNVDGDGVFAPGDAIASTSVFLDGTFSTVRTGSGTSFSAPFVAGAAAFLLSIEPTLTDRELKQLLTQAPYAAPQDGGGSTTATRLNLLFAAAGIDRIRPDRKTTVLSWLADFDDGSADGFRRVLYDDNGNDIGSNDDDLLGDDTVDLGDFRRLRDTLLLLDGYPLDGDLDHLKRDLNGNGEIEELDDETFPQVCMDQDQTLGLPAGFLDQDAASDIDVFVQAYQGDAVQSWSASDLRSLLLSADLLIRAADVLEDRRAEAVILTVEGDPIEGAPADLTPIEDIQVGADEVIVTTPLLHEVHIRWSYVVDGERQQDEFSQTVGELSPGEDRVVVLKESRVTAILAATSGSTDEDCCDDGFANCVCFGCSDLLIPLNASASHGEEKDAMLTFNWACEPVDSCSITGEGPMASLSYSFGFSSTDCILSVTDTVTVTVTVSDGSSSDSATQSIPVACDPSISPCF